MDVGTDPRAGIFRATENPEDTVVDTGSIARILRLAEHETVTQRGFSAHPDGTAMVTFGRTWCGLPVPHGEIEVDLDRAGRLCGARSRVAAPITLTTVVPALSEKVAAALIADLAATAELPALQRFAGPGDPPEPWTHTGTRLEVFGLGCPPRLAWNAELAVPGQPYLGAHILLDAHTGALVEAWQTGPFTPDPATEHPSHRLV